MFSGKSEELIRRLHVARHSKKVIMVLKPKRDTRAKNEVYSRKKKTKNSKRLLRSHKPDILAMDEGQFFDQKFDRFIKNLLKNKKYRRLTIIISGLDMTSEGDPFPGPMPQFMAMAHEIIKLKAVCFRCREWPPTAEMTYYKKKDKKDAVLVGDK